MIRVQFLRQLVQICIRHLDTQISKGVDIEGSYAEKNFETSDDHVTNIERTHGVKRRVTSLRR